MNLNIYHLDLDERQLKDSLDVICLFSDDSMKLISIQLHV